MKICHIIIGLNTGGAEHMLRRLVLHMKNNEYIERQVVISLTDIVAVGQLLVDAGIEVHAMDFKYDFSVIMKLWMFYKMLHAIRPDIIQTWMYHADLVGGLVGRLAGCKNIIWGIRGTWVEIGSSTLTPKIQWLCSKLSRYIPRFIVCAAYASRDAHIKKGYASEKMVVISNGFEFNHEQIKKEDIAHFRATYGINTNEKIVGIVARFNPAKDFQNFIQSSELVFTQDPLVKFLLIGRGCDQDNEELLAWINQTNCPEQFMLLGERRDVPLCLAAMDVFCLSSKTEGIPNVLGEAMAMKKLCVTTDVGDAAFLLGDTGIVVPKQNCGALSQGILKLLSLSQGEQDALRDKAYHRVTTVFTMARAKEEFEDLYNKLEWNNNFNVSI